MRWRCKILDGQGRGLRGEGVADGSFGLGMRMQSHEECET